MWVDAPTGLCEQIVRDRGWIHAFSLRHGQACIFQTLAQVRVGPRLVAAGQSHGVVTSSRGARVEVLVTGEWLSHQLGADDVAITLDHAAVGCPREQRLPDADAGERIEKAEPGQGQHGQPDGTAPDAPVDHRGAGRGGFACIVCDHAHWRLLKD